MLYDVSVTRTSTATRTIRVEADDMESDRGAALELAGDTDFTGSVVEYDLDANDAVEVKDENCAAGLCRRNPAGRLRCR